MKNGYKRKDGPGLFQGVFMAHFVLLLHVVLIASLGCLVLFFRGFVQYMGWIFLTGAAVILFSAFRINRRIKKEGRNLRELLKLPVFTGRSVEVSLLGGLASVKLNGSHPQNLPFLLEKDGGNPSFENPATSRIRELAELARLFENDLISFEEYQKTKAELLNGTTGP